MTSTTPRTAVSLLSVTGLLVAGLVVTTAAPAAAAGPFPTPSEWETFLVSQTDLGDSAEPYLTADGQRVAFTTDVGLVEVDDNELRDVYLSTAVPGSDDPFSGEAVLVSAPDPAAGDPEANGPSSEPVASTDGRYVAFTSEATNLVPGDTTEGRRYVYVRDTVLGTTFRVQAGAEPNGSTWDPDLSDDGRRLVFTSDATDLAPNDENGATDVFLADLDADADGRLGDVSIRRAADVVPAPPDGTWSGAISGNGLVVAFASDVHPLDPATPPVHGTGAGFLYKEEWTAGTVPAMLSGDAHDVAIDASGTTFAYILENGCEDQADLPQATVVAEVHAINGPYRIAVGDFFTDRRFGTVADPAISADGSTVAWTTTRPQYDFSGAVTVLPEPVVRVEQPAWWDAGRQLTCSGDGTTGGDPADTAAGSGEPSLSASGRTLAYSGPGVGAAERSVHAVDTHRHDGLSVTSTMGVLTVPSFITEAAIADIPATSLGQFAAALADAPIYRLPIYRLPIYRLPIYRLPIYRLLIDDAPIYRLPIYRLPIYRLPIYRLDIPGGWPELLQGTPFEGELAQSVTLAEVLEWAAGVLADPDSSADAGAIAERIQSVSLVDVDLDDTGIDSLSLASLVLADAHVADIPLPRPGDSNLDRWQAVAVEQGLDFTVQADTVLAELESAGLDIARSGIESVPLRALPIADTLFDMLTVHDPDAAASLYLDGTPLGALDVARIDPAARAALFETDPGGGALADVKASLSPSTSVADLAAVVPEDVTFGALLFSLLDSASYPWEQIPATALDPGIAAQHSPSTGCQVNSRCASMTSYQFSFDPGPGEDTLFAAPTASVRTPAGTRPTSDISAAGSGPDRVWDGSPYAGPIVTNGSLVQFPLDDTRAGTSIAIDVWMTGTTTPGDAASTAELTSGSLRAVSRNVLGGVDVTMLDDLSRNRVGGDWEDPLRTPTTLTEGRLYFEWVSPAWRQLNDESSLIDGPALDEDWYLVTPPQPGSRLVISTNASDGQLSLALFGSEGGSGAPQTTDLGIASAGPAPGVQVAEQTGEADAPAEAGADAGAPVPGRALLDQAVVPGGGAASIEAAGVEASASPYLLRVSSGDGRATSSLYTLRVRYVPEAPVTTCLPWSAPAVDEPGVVGTADPVAAETNTLYVYDQKRYGDVYGAGAAAAVRAALDSLDGTGDLGAGETVNGAVVAIDLDPDVQAARADVDENPCSIPARRALTAAINGAVEEAVGANRASISSIVIVGGDDIVPLAPVPQHTSLFNEAGHAADLRLKAPLGGGVCPASPPAGTVDPCATPLSAAAAANHLLSDDPYALATAYATAGGHLYVPTVGIGRLVESPAQITATIDRFLDAEGLMTADSTLTSGYGAWSELPDLVTSALTWREPSEQRLTGDWDAAEAETALFPDGGNAPRVVSVNTHADETRMLPGLLEDVPQPPETGLLYADGHGSEASLAGSVVFLIGCHAGSNLPTAYYGARTDWVDVFSQAAGFVGNTGYGLANNVTTALSERLLAAYASWIGVTVGDAPVTAGSALAYAKQSYLGGLGLYSGYDEKALMQTVYYGLPMYTFAGASREAPVPEVPGGLQDAQTIADGLSAASLQVPISLEQQEGTDAAGTSVYYYTANDQSPLTVPGQPVLPRIVSQLEPAPSGQVARGVLLTALTSTRDAPTRIAVSDATIGTPDQGIVRDGIAFPSTFATVTTQQTPSGPVDLLVVTPARVQASRDGTGVTERFTAMSVEVVYGDSSSDDDVAPQIRAVEVPVPGVTGFLVHVDGTGSGVSIVRALVQEAGSDQWQVFEGAPTATPGEWTIPYTPSGPYRWMVQAADGAGNVATESQRGRLETEIAPAPELADPGESAVLTAGERVVRSIGVLDAQPFERLTGTLTITEERQGGRKEVVDSAAVPVQTSDDGDTRALIDRTVTTPGVYEATLSVCRGDSCTTTTFGIEASAPNTAPAATVSLSSSDGDSVHPASVLTADAAGTDPDGDEVSLTYAWTRNGVEIAGQSGPELALDGIAAPGDEIVVTTTPHDGTVAGHSAFASVRVDEAPVLPDPPAITASATSSGDEYAEGAWSRTPVTVSFACSSGVLVVTCPSPTAVTADTGPSGVVVSGTMTDVLGRTATATFLVRVDATAPTLAPTVTPSTVPLGGTATAAANATDAGSGVQTQSCDAPQTSTAGAASVECRATDAAGNTTTASASYTVQAPSAPRCGGLPDRTALEPVEADGSSVFLKTSAVPILFRACDAAGKPITTKGFVKSVTLISTSALPSRARINEFWYPPLGTFTYVKLLGLWTGHIPTAKLASGKIYTYRVLLADGTGFTVTFGVR